MHNGRANTLTQMEELIVQNYNHPCIAVWGLSNEITAASAVNEELLENHRALNDLAHKLDPTRPTTMANVFMLEITSPILEIPDVNSYNLYFGWYLGELDQNDDFFDTYHAKYPDRCIGFRSTARTQTPPTRAPTPKRATIPKPTSASTTSTWQNDCRPPVAVGDPCLEYVRLCCRWPR